MGPAGASYYPGQEIHSAAGGGRSPKGRPKASAQGFQPRNPRPPKEETLQLSETYHGSLLPRDGGSNSSVLSYSTPAHPEQNPCTCTWPVSFFHTQNTTATTYQVASNQCQAPCSWVTSHPSFPRTVPIVALRIIHRHELKKCQLGFIKTSGEPQGWRNKKASFIHSTNIP